MQIYTEDELGDDMDVDKFLEKQSETRVLQPNGGTEGQARSTFAVASCEFKPTEGDDFWDKMLQDWEKEDTKQRHEDRSSRSSRRKVDYKLFYNSNNNRKDEEVQVFNVLVVIILSTSTSTSSSVAIFKKCMCVCGENGRKMWKAPK